MANMDLGILASDPQLVFKRKYRWTFALRWNGQDIPENFVKLASRPNLTIEETEINYLHGKMWIPGKATWESITVTFYDVASNSTNSITPLYSWLASIYNFQSQSPAESMKQTTIQGSSEQGGWSGSGKLTMYDGCGNPMETWHLDGVWPSAINFGDLDYSSSEEATVECTLRYYKARYEAKGCTRPPQPVCICCGGGGGGGPQTGGGFPVPVF